MFRLLIAVFRNLRRGPTLIRTMRKMTSNPDKYSEEEKYAYFKKLVRYLKTTTKIHTKCYGEENLPKEGGYVMFPNHQGKYDALGVIYCHKEPCTFVMDKAKSYSFLVKEMIELIDGKRLEIDNVRQNMTLIMEIAKEVEQGRKFILFSEGGYDKNGNNVQEFKPGSFKCATMVKAPIVPVALIDSYLPFNSSYNPFKKVVTKVIFCKPLYYDDYKDMKTPEIADVVKNTIVEAMKEYSDK